jgi:G:T/U-mismatch repair DNA glycosylase
MSGKQNYENLSSLNSSSETSSSETSSPITTTTTDDSVKKPFSWGSPSTWSTPSFSGMFKEESCEVKRDKAIEKTKTDYIACTKKRTTPKASGSMFSFLGLGPKPDETAQPVKTGGRKKTHKKEKKQKKKGKTNKRRTINK